jgi:hypothetical protein
MYRPWGGSISFWQPCWHPFEATVKGFETGNRAIAKS